MSRQHPATPLRVLREAWPLTQAELAQRASATGSTVSPSTIRNIEHQRVEHPHAATRRAIATALGIEVHEIAEFAEPVP